MAKKAACLLVFLIFISLAYFVSAENGIDVVYLSASQDSNNTAEKTTMPSTVSNNMNNTIPPEVQQALNSYLEKIRQQKGEDLKQIEEDRQQILQQGFFILKVAGLSLAAFAVLLFVGIKGYHMTFGKEERALMSRITDLKERGYDKDEIERYLRLEGHDKEKINLAFSNIKNR